MTGPAGMRRLDGGRFRMGADRFYREEGPQRAVEVAAFRIDTVPVTNREFRRFVEATGHVTLAERAPEYPGLPAALAQPGSLVFQPAADPARWWRFCPGADWRHPEGPGSSLDGLDDHPVVHVAHADAAAYAAWAGKALPTEAEWEYAARGGLDGRDYAWGDELEPDGVVLANYWRGEFPWRRTGPWPRTSPVGAFPANGFGLHDMIGNVWEWTADRFAAPPAGEGCCAGGAPGRERKVIKGGSHLCADSYCRRYRPAARQGQEADSATGHIGFRCVIRG